MITEVIEENERIAQQCKEEGRMHAFRQMQNRTVPSAFLEIARNSEFWKMPYEDLVPTEFATELFDEGNVDMLPPAVLLKKEQDDQYWERMIEESKEDDVHFEEEAVDKNQEDEALRKFIESSESEEQEQCVVEDSKEVKQDQRRKIQFQYQSALRNQREIDGNLRWVPVGQAVSHQ